MTPLMSQIQPPSPSGRSLAERFRLISNHLIGSVIVGRHDRAELWLAAAMYCERWCVVKAQLAQNVFPFAARKALDQDVLRVALGDRERGGRILVGGAMRLPAIAGLFGVAARPLKGCYHILDRNFGCRRLHSIPQLRRM